LKPCAEQVRQKMSSGSLIRAGEITEDLIFYLNLSFSPYGPGEVAPNPLANLDTYLLIPEIDSKGILQANPRLKVILESDERAKWKYQLIENIPLRPQK